MKMELYNKASLYDLFMKHIGKDYENEMLFIEDFISKDNLVLEIGGGTGNYSVKFKNKGYQVICSDISEDMLKEARKKDLSCIKLDMRNFNYERKVDVILILFNTIMYNTSVDELKQTINSCFNNLNQDGKLIIEVVNPGKLLGSGSHSYSLELKENVFLTHISKVEDHILTHFFLFCNVDSRETELDVHKMTIFTEERIKFLLDDKFSEVEILSKDSKMYFVAKR